MAVAANLSALTEGLVATVAKLDPKDSSRFRSLKRRTEDALKSNAYPRTDQFAVAHQLEGLQEKFQVLNRDELADALRSRLAELEQHQSRWFPEILSLLLQLADRPAQRSRLDGIEKAQPKEVAKPLSWSDLDGAGAAYCEEDIWEPVDFAGGSSDDDLSSVSSQGSYRRRLPEDPITPDEDYVIPDEAFFSKDTEEELVTSIERVQFWKEENNSGIGREGASSRVVTELQVVREAIFMLQGLPTSVFWHLDDGSVVVDRRYALKHLSNEALSSVLRLLSSTAVQIDVLRRFVKSFDQGSVPYMRTFNGGIEDCLNSFDKYLSKLQARYLCEGSRTNVSLLQLSDDVRRESRLLLLLASLVSDPRHKAQDNPVRCLELLHDLVCMTQATGDDDAFMYLAKLFFACFETYARPIRLWMETGQLEEPGAFFVLDNRNDNDLRTLWQGWYALDEYSGSLNAPNFIWPMTRKIFVTGKSRVFLRQLSTSEGAEQGSKSLLTFEDVFLPDSSFCLPFSELFESALARIVDENHSAASTLLRKELDQQCSLLVSLQSLEHIYLCKDMSVFASIDDKVFDLIDRGRAAWSDRFLLTELVQSAFSALPFVDPSRLIVRSSNSTVSKQSNRRSVTMLQAISLDYILPWPVANIVTRESILRYQRISIFLMQIRRATQMIVKQRLQYSDPTDRTLDDRSNTLSFALRHNMLWFLNTLYSHFTDFVISTTTESLQKSLFEASDVDSMIAVHRTYMSSLEDQCLISRNLHPLYRATITILDLCVSFADLQAMRHGKNRPDPTKVFYKHENSQIHNYGNGNSYMSDEDDDDDDMYDSDIDDMSASGISLHETHYVDRLKDIQDQFHRLIAFMVAGLKGVGRADGQLSWEILADKLEWQKERLYS
ncbi:Spc98 family-domain-containing protein [Aspergillus ambiguus]|uniref:putative gamma-tubulin complex component GCP5 n=1 Tax=Aspergillus ambiguus TaxID=176160 RepID=UPI003CCD89A4